MPMPLRKSTWIHGARHIGQYFRQNFLQSYPLKNDKLFGRKPTRRQVRTAAFPHSPVHALIDLKAGCRLALLVQAYRQTRKNMIGKVCSCLHPAPGIARGAHAPAIERIVGFSDTLAAAPMHKMTTWLASSAAYRKSQCAVSVSFSV